MVKTYQWRGDDWIRHHSYWITWLVSVMNIRRKFVIEDGKEAVGLLSSTPDLPARCIMVCLLLDII
ncbi:MAG: hypothetical protein NPIRA04_01950 [Nitrospirales bacterium]|nr:MAG: hypothetical protein NPIRA04_01950 [Nitrospirales bacterium]